MKRNKINIILTLVFGVVAIISFLLLCFNLTSNEIVAITSALISLSGGGLVSVIVTWFINIDQQKREKKRKALIRDNVLLPTYNTLYGFIYNIARLYELINNNIDNNEKRSWKEWLDVLIIDIVESNNQDGKRKCLHSFCASINNMRNRIYEIRCNRVSLLLDEMISNKEYYAFCELDYYFNKIEHEVINKNIRGLVDELLGFLKCGEEIFGQINCGVNLNNIKYTVNEFSNFIKDTKGKTYAKRILNAV